MKVRDIFGLVIRLLGVLFLYRAAENMPMLWRVFTMGYRHFAWSLFFDSLFIVAWPLVVAVWLLKGAPPAMKWAYPDADKR
jgi:hypothetical protein